MSNAVMEKYKKQQTAFEQILTGVLDWSLVKKSQAILLYAMSIQLGLFYLQVSYLHSPLVNNAFLTAWLWFLPTLLIIDIFLFCLGFYIRHYAAWHLFYTIIVVLYYALSLMFLPIVVGLLNIANGIIFVGTTMVSLLLFPRSLVYSSVVICAVVYIVAAWMVVQGQLDYALALQQHVFLHPDVQAEYITYSMIYSVLYAAMTIFLLDTVIRIWQETAQYNNQLSCTDELTTLLNRRGMHKILALQLQQARIAQQEIAIIIVDLDDFKRINDQYGHQQGDYILKAVAQRLTDQLRSSDIVARYGGEEFIMLLPYTNGEQAYAIAEQCRCALADTLFQDGITTIAVHASFGVSSTKVHFDFDELFYLADQALYQAKKQGKNRVQYMAHAEIDASKK